MQHAAAKSDQGSEGPGRRGLLLLWAALSAASLALAEPAVGRGEGAALVAAARAQVGKTLRYDPSYQTLEYPGGDVPLDRGVCSDVVIRAFRSGLGLDLQKLVHEDMARAFGRYPRNWGLRAPDRNIDHRRVPNLRTYFTRMGYSLPVSHNPADYEPGDLVTCTVPPNLPHLMVVSDRRSPEGRPLVLHNIGAGAREEDSLFAFELTGHYRVRRAVGPSPR